MEQLGGLAVGGLDKISTDNVDALNKAVQDKKKAAKEGTKGPKAKSATERKAEAIVAKEAAKKELAKEYQKVPPAIGKKFNRQRELKAAKGSPGYFKKLNIIQRYLDNRVLSPIIHGNVAPSVLHHDPGTEAEADAKLAAFRQALNARRMDGKIDLLLPMGAKLVEKFTNNGERVGMDLSGFAQKVFADQDDVRQEIEEFKCMYGGMFSAPWWVGILQFYMAKAVETHQENSALSQQVSQKGKSREQSVDQDPQSSKAQ